MKFVPFGPSLARIPNIMVDSGRTADTVLELSHWPGNRTPKSYKADTSSEIVLNFLRSRDVDNYFTKAAAVSNDHYDIDGLLAIWSVLNSAAAQERAGLITSVAVTGDFDLFTTTPAVQTCLSLDGIEKQLTRKWVHDPSMTTEVITGLLYHRILPFVLPCLDQPRQFQHLWEKEYSRVENSLRILESGKAHLTEVPEIDLAIIESDHPLEDLAIYRATGCLRVLSIVEGSKYCFRYRYESFVEMISRQVLPRIRLENLADQLNDWERNTGRWVCESVATAHPRLQLYSRQGVPSSSSILAKRLVQALCDFLSVGAQNVDLQWRSEDWPYESTSPMPPSMQTE